jgi:hypothetical protein
MKHMMTVLALVAAVCTGSAFAADAGCEMQAADKKLAGAAKSSFVKKCEKDQSAAAPADTTGGTCSTQAADKKLAGAAKNSFVKKCEKDAKAQGASGVCDAKAAEKKLYGAAKTSFVKKCRADSAG